MTTITIKIEYTGNWKNEPRINEKKLQETIPHIIEENALVNETESRQNLHGDRELLHANFV